MIFYKQLTLSCAGAFPVSADALHLRVCACISEASAEEWTHTVCAQLKCLWKNGSSSLDLGLGTGIDPDGCVEP